MSTTQTAEGFAHGIIRAMGKELGEAYSDLWSECSALHCEWKEFRELYMTKPSRIETMRNTAPSFFLMVQNVFLDHILLHLCRMTDSPKSCGKENLTLLSLPPLLRNAPITDEMRRLAERNRLPLPSSQDFSQEIQRRAARASDRCRFAQDRRNRRIAHRDMKIALGLDMLPSVESKQIDDALASIRDVMGRVSLRYRGCQTAFDLVQVESGAVVLLDCLRDGLSAEDERRRRMLAGRPEQRDRVPKTDV